MSLPPADRAYPTQSRAEIFEDERPEEKTPPSKVAKSAKISARPQFRRSALRSAS